MKKLTLFFLLALVMPFISFSQQQQDSTEILETKILKLYTDALKTVEESSDYKEYKSKLIQYNKRHNNYDGWSASLFYSNFKATSLNNSLVSSGFSKMQDFALGFGVSGHFKRNNYIMNINLASVGAVGAAQKSSTNQHVELSSLDFLQTEIGYTFVNKPNFTFYPYAGLGLRTSLLMLENTQIINTAGTNISNFVNTPRFVRANSFKVTYQLGLAMDVKVGNNDKKSRGTFLFAKAGLNNTIGDEKFRIDGQYKFNPNLQLGGPQFQIGLKFVRYNTSVKPSFEN